MDRVELSDMRCGLPKAHKKNYIDNGVSKVAGNVHFWWLAPTTFSDRIFGRSFPALGG